MKLYYILIALLFVGCTTTKPKYDFPSYISNVAHGEKNAAKTCIQSKGQNLKEKHKKLTLIIRDGEKKFTSGWGWKSLEWNGMWVLGLTHNDGKGNYRIEVACNPKTKQEISVLALRHEFGHFWLMSCFGDDSHNSKYDSCFWNWKEPQIKSLTIEPSDGSITIIHFIFEE